MIGLTTYGDTTVAHFYGNIQGARGLVSRLGTKGSGMSVVAASNPLAEILRSARAIIADPEHWTVGELAITNTGMPVAPDDPYAYAFCAQGAVYRALGIGRPDQVSIRAVRALNKQLPACVFLTDFNDDDEAHRDDGDTDDGASAKAHAAVLAVFDRAIAAAERGEG